MMKLLCGIVLLVGSFTLNDAFNKVAMKSIAVDQLLMQDLMNAKAGNPQYSAPCFAIHIPILQGVLNEYSTSYQLCTTVANEQIALLNEEAKGNKTEINESAQSVCSSMSDCSALDESLDFLDCYSKVGDANVRTLYSLTADATEVAANLREQYRLVTNVMERCQQASERAYVEGTTAATDSLNECLANGPKPSTVAPTPEVTTAATPEEPATEEPATEEPATEEPTESPEN